MAKGEYMALFNNDAFAEPTWLAELPAPLRPTPRSFAVSSLMLRFYEPELADDAGDYVTILGFACARRRPRQADTQNPAASSVHAAARLVQKTILIKSAF